MKKRKLGIIGGSGLYKMEGFEKAKWKKISTPWGKPSDEMLLAAESEAQYRSIEPQDVLSEWLQLGYQQGC